MKQTNVLVKCPDCGLVYVQRVTGPYIGPRRRAYNTEPDLQDACDLAGQTDGDRSWYGLMRCAKCSLQKCPPALRDALAKWLEHGEVREG